ncbi:MAG: hypothetical protein AAFV93_16970, partial [Chloroflexota bacterium]
FRNRITINQTSKSSPIFEIWQETGDWELDVLHLRLVLFFAFRSDYMSGYTYTEHDEIVDSILNELSKQLDLPYAGKDNG